jgi:hypothetical protein
MTGKHNIIISLIFMCSKYHIMTLKLLILGHYNLHISWWTDSIQENQNVWQEGSGSQSSLSFFLVGRSFVLSCRPTPPYKQKSAVFHVRTLLVYSQAWPLSVRDIIANQLGKYLKLPVFIVISKLTLSFWDPFYTTWIILGLHRERHLKVQLLSWKSLRIMLGQHCRNVQYEH